MIYTNRISYNTRDKTEKSLKFVGQQNQDICMLHICFVMFLGARLDLKSTEK